MFLSASQLLSQLDTSPKSHVSFGTRNPAFAAITDTDMENSEAISEANSYPTNIAITESGTAKLRPLNIAKGAALTQA